MPEDLFQVGTNSIALVQGDITHEETEAIANAANGGLLGGGGVDGAIHRAAGKELLEACRKVKQALPDGRLATGKAVLTPGFKLKARHVIHCVGPVYSAQGVAKSRALLQSCYLAALRLCQENRIASIAFPSISTGVYHFPVEEAAPIALEAVAKALRTNELPRLVRFVLFDSATFAAYAQTARKLFAR
jgi:O-acetyl-ADP-ribose deacetylase (regulator of RNase III)